ncbi:MAG TPA: Hsp20/alpha crystallin family protein [Polyangiaceae bacterium]|nr:Hsp20/alpha crystallin family protein [Polyangiaceae bacterium]
MSRLVIQSESPPQAVFSTPFASGGAESPWAGGVDGSFAPAFEVWETERTLVIRADVPGVKPEDLSLFLEDSRVTICGRRKQDDLRLSLRCRAYERTYGAFWRSFRMSPMHRATRARASLVLGVLTVVVHQSPALEPS